MILLFFLQRNGTCSYISPPSWPPPNWDFAPRRGSSVRARPTSPTWPGRTAPPAPQEQAAAAAAAAHPGLDLAWTKVWGRYALAQWIRWPFALALNRIVDFGKYSPIRCYILKAMFWKQATEPIAVPCRLKQQKNLLETCSIRLKHVGTISVKTNSLKNP